MKTHRIIISALLAAMTLGVSVNAETTKERIHAAFEKRMTEMSDPALKQQLSNVPTSERERRIQEGLEFLYAYMPLADLLNYSPDYFRRNVEASIDAQDELAWGKDVPEREFRHFVLPVRVNNEDLDESRSVFFRELKDRVKGMSMEDAILEVNHWCHEKVTYQPSDARTSSPLSAVSQAIGRCGEESTFTVAALRAVGIPARQVYTPRWAHTDDNHAWVEAWANGKWYFLGACEPEPILNLAWFNAPASRGMLMNTRAYGDYDGPEDVIDKNSTNTIINVTSNYAPVKPVQVIVKDKKGKTVADANVRFCLYNYSEYYPLALKKSNGKGEADLTVGEGDLVVWATDGKNFGFAKANSSMRQPVEIILDKDSSTEYTTEFDIVPPAPSAQLPKPTAEQQAQNEARKEKEDSIRKSYTATFAGSEEAQQLAREIGLNDATALEKILIESRGNHKNISEFLRRLKATHREKAIAVLEAVSEKDRRDIPMSVVADRFSIPMTDSPLFREYILNPRVENEGLTPFATAFLRDMGGVAATEKYRKNPAEWVERVGKDIVIDTDWTNQALRIHPAAVWKAKKSDTLSRDIFFVASARAMGIPARMDQVTGKTQWHNGKEWIDAKFNTESGAMSTAAPTGKVNFTFETTGRISDPVYYSQFSLSKIEDGNVRLLDFDEMLPLSELTASHPRFDTGQYVMTTGQRMADGSVLARTTLFTVEENGEKTIPLIVRQDNSGIQVVGSFNSEDLYQGRDGRIQNLLSTTGRGYYTLIYGKPNHEPTSHVLNDISAVAKDLEADGRKIILLYGDQGQLERAQLERFSDLPSNVVAGCDIDGNILKELEENLHLTEGDLPVVIVADTFNRVVFVSQGYAIGMGEKLMDVLRRVE